MLILNQQAVAEALSHGECVEALEPAMRAVSEGGAILPLRQYLNVPNTQGKFTLMPGYVDNPSTFGVKIVSKFPRDADSPYGSHVGAVMVFDTEMGIPLALLDGSELTAIRTAAASALATRVLARQDASVVAILGAGTEALHHIKAMGAVRNITEFRIWNRSAARADKLIQQLSLPPNVAVKVAPTVKDAVAGADIVCTTTSATTPILEGRWLADGTHVNLVGAAIIDAAEADVDVVARSRFFIDYRESALAQAGELAAALAAGIVTEAHIVGEIGDVLAGRADGRLTDTDITTYKSLGVAAQDLAAGIAAFNNAKQRGIGVEVDWT